MTSPAQQTASRTNGAQSRGPTTQEGKAKSAANSRKHGLCSKEFVLETPDEQARFAELERETRFTYQAKNPLEEEACHHLAVAIWRRRVCDNLEKDLLLAIQNGTACAQNGGDGLPGLNAVNRYRARIARDLREAREELNQLRAARVKAFADEMNKAKEMTDKNVTKWLIQDIGMPAFEQFRASVTNEPETAAKASQRIQLLAPQIETRKQDKRKAQKQARKVTRNNRK